MTATYLSEQQGLGVDSNAMQQINFTRNKLAVF